MGTENPEAGEGAIRLKITSALAGIGAGGGTTAGLVPTYFGNVISGYPITPGPSWRRDTKVGWTDDTRFLPTDH